MQYNNEECTNILKSLIIANSNRIIHYSEAIQLLNKDTDADLMLKFESLAQQSQQFKAQLTPLLYREGDSRIAVDSAIKNKWQSGQANQADSTRIQTLKASLQVEAELKQIYHEVDHCNNIIEDQIKELIISQTGLLEESYSEIVQLMKGE